MLKKMDTHMLSGVLDEIWRNPKDSVNVAKLSIHKLSDYEWLLLASWDTAASFGPVLGNLDLLSGNRIQITDNWRRLFLEAILTNKAVKSDEQLLISYLHSEWSVIVATSSPYVPKMVLTRDPFKLLIAMQLIRDYLDSSLYKPKLIRDTEISNYAQDAHLDDEHFRRLASWFPNIEFFLQKS